MSYYDKPVWDAEYWADLRRKANANLNDVFAGKFRKEPKPKKLTELEQASAYEISLGFIVLERRSLHKQLHRLLAKKMSQEELGWAEELQSQLDEYDAVLERYDRDGLKRLVRLWNKSRKAKYSMKGVKL